jgi:hypothetical protein
VRGFDGGVAGVTEAISTELIGYNEKNVKRTVHKVSLINEHVQVGVRQVKACG